MPVIRCFTIKRSTFCTTTASACESMLIRCTAIGLQRVAVRDIQGHLKSGQFTESVRTAHRSLLQRPKTSEVHGMPPAGCVLRCASRNSTWECAVTFFDIFSILSNKKKIKKNKNSEHFQCILGDQQSLVYSSKAFIKLTASVHKM
jgi:hypothetical protein